MPSREDFDAQAGDERRRRTDRPRPPLAIPPAKSEATRPFPLQAPRRDPGLGFEEVPTVSIQPDLLAANAAPPPGPATPTAPSVLERAPSGYAGLPPELALPPERSESPAAYAPRASSAPPRRRSVLERVDPRALAAAIGVFAALVMGALVLMLASTFRDDPQDPDVRQSPVIAARPLTTARPQPTEPTQRPALLPSNPSPNAGCRLVMVPRRVAGPIVPSVPPMVAAAPGQSRVAIGYASAKNHAEGVIVNLDDLSVEPRYTEEFNGPVFRVTPLADRAPVAFAVDRDDPRIQVLRTVPASPPLRIGTSYFGLVRANETTSPTVIWPGARFDSIGEPAFAITERDGYGIAFRSGRGGGDVQAGWLTPSGTADGDLARIDAGAREVGAPSIAAGDHGVVVAFAARAAGEPWHVRVAVAPRGKVPAGSRELSSTAAGAVDAILPSIVTLPNGGYLLQWLEGPAGARRVVARTYDDKLTQVGVPIELAQGVGIQETPGALVVRSGKVLALHSALVEKNAELRGAVLFCG